MSSPRLSMERRADADVLSITGQLVTALLASVERDFARVRAESRVLQIDLSHMDDVDTGGAMMIAQLQARLESDGISVSIVGLSNDRRAFLETVRSAIPETVDEPPPAHGLRARVERLGQGVVGIGAGVGSFLNFLGLTIHRLLGTVIRPWRLRGTALTSQMEVTGLNAVPIVVLMSFLIGVVLAFQGAAQLRQFGAEVFVVDLIAISILRELGILLTAIIVAGRSGSAFTAAIGSMKVREELDAMRTLGLDPIEVLVLPRVLALVIMLPVLGFIANISGLLGGALMSWVELGVSPGMFLTRLYESTDAWHLAIGMIKAPFFALAIGITACWQAMLVQGSSESVGQRTTASVVQAIFLVIVLDAAFSIFFAEIGV